MTLRYAPTLSDCVSVRTPVPDRNDAAGHRRSFHSLRLHFTKDRVTVEVCQRQVNEMGLRVD